MALLTKAYIRERPPPSHPTLVINYIRSMNMALVTISLFFLHFQFISPALNVSLRTCVFWVMIYHTHNHPCANMEEALFDWPIVLQYDVKGKYRLVSRKFSRKEVVSAEHSLNHPKAKYARFYPRDELIKSLYLRSLAVSVLLARFSFQGHAKIALMMRKHALLSSF